MIGVVAVFAFWLASLRSASVWWTAAASTLTLAFLLTGVLGSIFLKGPDRAYWSGFALFGWTYLLLVNWEFFGGQFSHDLTGGLGQFAEWVLPRITSPPAINPGTVFPIPPRLLGFGQMPGPTFIEASLEHSIKLGNFVQIGRMGFTLLFAMLGGLIGRILNDRAERLSE